MILNSIQYSALSRIRPVKMSFKDKVVLVTGASSGIGAAIATLFSKEGAKVAIVGRNEIKLQDVAGKCVNKPLVVIGDVTKDDEGKRIVEETIKEFGKLDVLINNAGLAELGTILDGKILEAYDKIMNVNLRAVINITSAAAPHLTKTKGNIINISSVLGMVTLETTVSLAYSLSKAALDHFTKGAALELSSVGVRVNSINPGPVRTDFLINAGISETYDSMTDRTPLRRISGPNEIAEMTLFLASDKAVGITGSLYVVDNGNLLGFN